MWAVYNHHAEAVRVLLADTRVDVNLQAEVNIIFDNCSMTLFLIGHY